MSKITVPHKYDKSHADKLIESTKFRSCAHICDEIARGTDLSYPSFMNYLAGRSTGEARRKAIEAFFDEQLTETNK